MPTSEVNAANETSPPNPPSPLPGDSNSGLTKFVPIVLQYVKDNWQKLTGVAAIPTIAVIYGAFRAKPEFFLWPALVVGMIAIRYGAVMIRSRQPRGRVLTLCSVALVGMSLWGLLNLKKVRVLVLDHYYQSFDLKRLKFNTRSEFNRITVNRGSAPQIMRVPLWVSPEARKIVLEDEEPKQQQELTDLEKALLPPPPDPRNPSKSCDHNNDAGHCRYIYFLLGQAGMGKETVLRQWSRLIAERAGHPKPAFDHVFLLRPDDLINAHSEKQGDKGLSWMQILARSDEYKDVVGREEYYYLLLQRESCLIVIPGWEKLDELDRNHLLTISTDLVENSEFRTTVLIASRLDKVTRDFIVKGDNGFKFEPSIRYLLMLDWDESEWVAFSQRKSLAQLIPRDSYNVIEKYLLSRHPNLVLRNLGRNLDYLNLMVEQAPELERHRSDYELASFFINRVLDRKFGTYPEDKYKAAIKRLSERALEASNANTTNLEFDGTLSAELRGDLDNSPVVTIQN